MPAWAGRHPPTTNPEFPVFVAMPFKDEMDDV